MNRTLLRFSLGFALILNSKLTIASCDHFPIEERMSDIEITRMVIYTNQNDFTRSSAVFKLSPAQRCGRINEILARNSCDLNMRDFLDRNLDDDEFLLFFSNGNYRLFDMRCREYDIVNK